MIEVDGTKQRYVWRIGPSIRECCIRHLHEEAIAAWWWEVKQRFEDLKTADFPEAIDLLEQKTTIEAILALKVPKPISQATRVYERFRRDLGLARRVKPKPPSFVAILDVEWPCTEVSVKDAWKKLALKHHPDRGGSTEEFIKAKTAYDKALSYLEALA